MKRNTTLIMDKTKNSRSHWGIQKQIGSVLFKMILLGNWTKAQIFLLQNYFPGCKWTQMSILQLEFFTKQF